MSQIENLLTALIELRKQKTEVDALKESVLKEIAPYHVGQEVDIKGYSHSGKRGIVTRMALIVDHKDRIDLMVNVDVLRKDGCKSNFRANWDSYSDPILKNALQKILLTDTI